MANAASSVPRVLVIDDDLVMLESCRRILERIGCAVDTEPDALTGRDRVLEGSYDLVLLDLRMPKVDGLEVLAALGEHRSDLEVIIITGYSTVGTAVQAVKLGAFDYLPKPFTPDELRARAKAALDHLAARRTPCLPSRHESKMVGDSPVMAEVHALIARVAGTDASVLIVGESGTGKELAAVEIHSASRRRERPFVSLDCSTLAPGLLESELFGHVKGSFTGAIASKPGLFETADRGTLFLDEISSLAAETQGKLLRVLETGEIKPVGGIGTRKVDIRLIAASNRPPEDLVREKTFREDLYYRLNVVPLRLPPLRERGSDIPQLVQHFLVKYRSNMPRAPHRFSPDALQCLANYQWPGNVRELKNLVERLVVTVGEDTIRVEHLPDVIRDTGARGQPCVPHTNEELKAMKRQAHQQLCGEIERSFVLDALRRCNWNVSRAARETGVLRPNFHALMRKYGIRAEDN